MPLVAALTSMTAVISHTTIDCANAYDLSQWWKHVLGYVDVTGDPNLPGHEECAILHPDTGHRLLFVQVADLDQDAKNRIHFDLRPQSGTQESELALLLELGAQLHADHRGIYGPGTGWVVLKDPEGNLFCILHHESELPVPEDQVPQDQAQPDQAQPDQAQS